MTDDGNAPTVPDTQAPTAGASSSGPAIAPDPRYALRTLLGKGGMGEVWLAHDQRIDREIAVKLMRGGATSEGAVARFLREARVQGRLEHPSVVPVHDIGGDDGGTPYFAMKRLTGTTLADVLAAGDQAAWPRRTLLARFVDVCLAVEFAHQRGIVHRDLKPANIMLGDFGEAYVLDWGLARIASDADATVARPSDSRDSGAGHTEAGAMLGTPGYMAPEQMRGEPIDHRTDIYALGCILFEILTGTPAIARDHTIEQTLSAPHHRPSQRSGDVPPELDDACVRATAADPASRLRSARALADMVQRFLDGDRDLERRRELAIEHASRAQLAFARGGEAGRGEAMREAGSAIALDPGNRDAKAILARLLLEPPDTLPAEVAQKIDDERQAAARAVMRGGVLGYAFFLLSVPIVYALGVSTGWPLVAVAVALAVMMVFCMGGARGAWRIEGRLAVASVVMHCSLLAGIGFLVGPLFLLPILLFGSSTIMATFTTVRMPIVVVVSHLLAIGVPLVVEWLALVPSSYVFVDGALVLDPWAIEITSTAALFLVLATIVLQLVSNTIVHDAQRRLQNRAQEQLHVQAWQLSQLVPSSGSTA